jgi:hypothetical protein
MTGTIQVPPLPLPERSCNFPSVSLVQGQSPSQGDKPVEAPLIILDSLDLKDCAAIKIDVEGMESKVLAGVHNLIKRCQPALYIEANSSECTNPMIEFFKEWNYDAYWSIYPYYDADNYFRMPTMSGPRPSVFNLICVPRYRSNMKTLPGFRRRRQLAQFWSASTDCRKPCPIVLDLAGHAWKERSRALRRGRILSKAWAHIRDGGRDR